MYTHGARFWALFIVQGPVSVTYHPILPRTKPYRYNSHSFSSLFGGDMAQLAAKQAAEEQLRKLRQAGVDSVKAAAALLEHSLASRESTGAISGKETQPHQTIGEAATLLMRALQVHSPPASFHSPSTLPPLSLSLSPANALRTKPRGRGPSGARAATLLNTPPSLSLSLSASLSLSPSLLLTLYEQSDCSCWTRQRRATVAAARRRRR
jgi:hypothetical protein